jgi:hypothetical protein
MRKFRHRMNLQCTRHHLKVAKRRVASRYKLVTPCSENGGLFYAYISFAVNTFVSALDLVRRVLSVLSQQGLTRKQAIAIYCLSNLKESLQQGREDFVTPIPS